ncbi:MAG: prenyltransferase [Myxococcota bacterium]
MPPLAQMSTLERWTYAIKPKSWPKLLVPTFLGQALGAHAAGAVDPVSASVGVALTLGIGVFIVLLNDWSDEDVDRIKREMFPDGCSPKTIPDGILPSQHLLAAGLAAGFVALMLGCWYEVALQRAHATAAVAGALAIFWAYSLPPLRLNYRGGGEVLEMLGVGGALPLLHAYVQGGVAWHEDYWVLAGYMLLALTSALASGLSDEESDRAGHKTTFTTLFGNRFVVRAIDAVLLASALSWLALSFLYSDDIALVGALVSAAFYIFERRAKVRALGLEAKTNAFPQIAAYKQALHRVLWRAGMMVGGTFALLTAAEVWSLWLS